MTPFASVPRRTIEFETATTGGAGKGPLGQPGKLPDRPGLHGDMRKHQRGKTEKGNRIKEKSSLNTKGDLGKGSTHSRECPESGTGLHRSRDSDKGGLQERTALSPWHRGMALQQPAQHRCVRRMHFPWRL